MKSHLLRIRTLRLAIWAVGITALVLATILARPRVAAWQLWLSAPSEVALLPLIRGSLVSLAWGYGFALLGLAVAWRGPSRVGELMGGLFFVGLSASIHGGWVFIDGYWPAAPLPVLLGAGLAYAAGVRFTILFPEPLTREQVLGSGPRWFRRSAAPLLAFLLPAGAFWTFAVVLEGVLRLTHSLILGYLGLLLWAALATSYLWLAYRSADQAGRRRMFWVMETALIFLVVELVQAVMELYYMAGLGPPAALAWSSWLDVVECWGALICMGIAVFGRGAFDSGLVLRRTAVVSAASGTAVLLFLALEEMVEGFAGDLLGLSSGLGSIMTGVLAALVFQWLARKLDRYWKDGRRGRTHGRTPA